MDSGASCICDSSDPTTDPTEYLEALKRKYLDRTAKLQSQQIELEKKIMQMEMFLGKKEIQDSSDLSSCSCDHLPVPKVFPETPVRDSPGPNILAGINPEHKPVVQQCSFFQKMMENARSILSMKCQCASPFVSAKSTSITPNEATTSDFTPSEPPTRENDTSTQPIEEEEETTVTDKSSKISICSCDDSDPSTLQEASCSCHIDAEKPSTVPQGQQVSMDPSSSSPKESQGYSTNNKTTEGPTPDSSHKKNDKCPFDTGKDTSTSEITSNCSCEMCRCDSSIVDNKLLNLDNFTIDPLTAIPKVSVFADKGDHDNLNAEVQATTAVSSKGINFQLQKDTASKCVTCCRNKSCPSSKFRKDVGDNLNAGIQVASYTQSKGVNIHIPKDTMSIGIACCSALSCPNNRKKTECRGKCNPPLIGQPDGPEGPYSNLNLCRGKCNLPLSDQPDGAEGPNSNPHAYNEKTPDGSNFDDCREKCETTRQDGQNQCAFVGSPLLNPTDFVNAANQSSAVSSRHKVSCDCNTLQGHKQICQNSVFSLTSNDIVEIQNIAELAKKEKEMKAQIQELQKRERTYQEAAKNMETLATKTANPCCCCQVQNSNKSSNVQEEIKKISQELRLENQMLKSELIDMKIELKHCIEKVEGPMKQKLQLEKQKCEVFQQKLQDASKNMLLSQDAYSREMNELKLQLCCACSNITELNQMNGRLRDEMANLDCLCSKLEDDLVKQKLNEADTIKRLTTRKFGGDGPHMQKSEEYRSDSNLDIIARKLSKTLKELAPCEECSKLPAELAGAAKCIKELTDMVRKRRERSSSTSGCCCSGKSPSKPSSKEFSEEECCSCCSPTERGDRRQNAKTRTKTTKPSSQYQYGCTCQTRPVSKPSSNDVLKGRPCSCSTAQKDGAGEPYRRISTPEEKAVKTLLSVPDSFVQKEASSKFDVDVAASSYYTTNGDPVRDILSIPCAKIGRPCLENKGTGTEPEAPSSNLPCSNIGAPCQKEKPVPKDSSSMPCAHIGKPCLESKGTLTAKEDLPKKELPCSNIGEPCKKEKKETTPIKADISRKGLPCSNIGEPCQKDKKPKTEITSDVTPEVTKADKSCKAPCSEILEPVKDKEAESTFRPEEETAKPDIGRVSTSSSIVKRDIASIPKGIIERLPDAIQEVSEAPTSKDESKSDAGPLGDVLGLDKDTSDTKPDDQHVITTEWSGEPSEQVEKGEAAIRAADSEFLESEEAKAVDSEFLESQEGPEAVKQDVQHAADIEIALIAEAAESSIEQEEHKESQKYKEPRQYRGPEEFVRAEEYKETEEYEEPESPTGAVEFGERVGPFQEEQKGSKKYIEPGQYQGPEEFEGAEEYKETEEHEEPKSPAGAVKFGEREVPFQEDRFGDFPFDVQNKAFALSEPPDGLHVTTTVTDSGTLEVITEGPGGTIETTLTYTEDGNIEVITEMVESTDDQQSVPTERALEKYTTEPTSKVPCVPEETCHSMEKIPGTTECDDSKPCADMGGSGKHKLKPVFPVASSKFSGPSGPELSTPYTPSLESGEGELTSKLASGSSGIKVKPDVTPDLSSGGFGEIVEQDGTSPESMAKISPDVVAREKRTPVKVPSAGSEAKNIKSGEPGPTPPSAQDAIRQDIEGPTDTLTSEGQSTGVDMPSGEVFTPDQVVSDIDEELPRQPVVKSTIAAEILSSEISGAPDDIKVIKKEIEEDGFVALGPEDISGVQEGEGQPSKHEIKKEIPSHEEMVKVKQEVLSQEEFVALEQEVPTYEELLEAKEEIPEEFVEVEKELPREGEFMVTKEEVPVDAEITDLKKGVAGKEEFMDTTEDLSTLGAGEPTEPEEKRGPDAEISASFGQKDTSKQPDDTLGRRRLPGTSSAGSPKTRDCFCQSKDQKDQSCQCCECKNIGVTTSGDKETITAEEEAMCKTPQEENKTDTDTEFVTTSETTDNVFVQRPITAKKSRPKTAWQKRGDLGLIIDEKMLKKHPDLEGKNSAEQERILTDLGYFTTGRRMPRYLMEKYPELEGKTSDEQQLFLVNQGYDESIMDKTSSYEKVEGPITGQPVISRESQEGQEIFLEDIGQPVSLNKVLDKEMSEKHPEIESMSKEYQRRMLGDREDAPARTEKDKTTADSKILPKHSELSSKSKENQPIKQIQSSPANVDEKLLQKHPELAGKSYDDQQTMLKAMSITSDQHTASDQKLLDKPPELIGKSSEQNEKMVKNLEYGTSKTTSKIGDPDMLETHPKAMFKDSKQKQIKDLGYETPQTTSVIIDQDILKKHPELAGKSSEQQKDMLENLGYVTPAVTSVIIDQELLKQHPELAGKSSKQQQQILENLGYVTPKTTSLVIDSELLKKHPELSGKSSKQQQQILENLGYVTPKTTSVIIDQEMLKKHPDLAGKNSKQQQQILENLGYVTPKTTSVIIDQEILKKHPELAGKSSKQQQQILENLGYVTPKTTSVIIDQEVLNKHPELAGMSSKQQQQILENLGYVTPRTTSVIIDQEMLNKHPELAGKSSRQQQQILENLGYVTPKTTSGIIDQEMLRKQPELPDKSSKEQQILENLKKPDQQEILSDLPSQVHSKEILEVSRVDKLQLSSKEISITCKAPCRSAATTHDDSSKPSEKDITLVAQAQSKDMSEDSRVDKLQLSSKEISITCKAPCRSAATTHDDSSKPSEKDITMVAQARSKDMSEDSRVDKLQLSSKEVSITCKAPCRSAATIHDDSAKPSEKDITMGDVSSASCSKSKSISLQQKPSSRDDSASCKASCRTISVQITAGKKITLAMSTSATSSSSDTADKGKKNRKEKMKSRPGEVPSIVSELSDKERPVIEPTKKSKAQRKKRSLRMMDCIKCVCPEPCKCEVCSPEITAARKRSLGRPMRSCDCPPEIRSQMAPQIMPQIMIPPMQMAYSMPLPSHARGCTCNQCIFNPCTPRQPDFGVISMVEGDSPTSDENDVRKIRKHSSKCECVDCLCLPKIKKLAETKEYPIIYDEKQVYQVKTNCDTCSNAQNARRYIDQQRSRIPISTSTPNPPRLKSESSKSAASASKVEEAGRNVAKASDQKPPITGKLSHTDSVYNSVACDCAECKCVDCPDPKSNKPTKGGEAAKNDKDCCCQGPCTCKPCTVEELAKKLQEAEGKLAAAQAAQRSAPEAPSTKSPSQPHGDDCICPECLCPRSDLMPGKDSKPAVVAPSKNIATAQPSEECTCPECVTCPRSDLMRKGPGGGSANGKPSESGDEEDCTCPECVCPGADTMEPKPKSSAPASAPPPPASVPKPTGKGEGHPPDCDCPECSCPGLDDLKKKGAPAGAPGAAAPGAAAPGAAAPGAAAPGAAAPGAAAPSGGGDDDCDCQVCECPGKTSLPPVGAAEEIAPCDCKGCSCEPCADPKLQKGVVAPEIIADCDCKDCKCSPCADPKKVKGEPKVSEKVIGEHPESCDCPTCACPTGAGDVRAKESKGTGVPEKIPHPPDCDCDECLCLEEIIKSELGKEHPEDCDCPVCTCPGGGDIPGMESKGIGVPSMKELHPPDCDCEKCTCPGLKDQGVQPSADKSVHPPDCTCEECTCPGIIGDHKPEADKEVHALNCACPDCLCPECTALAAHVPGCRCDQCICSPCEYKGESAIHPGGCSCIRCLCDKCVDPSKQQAAEKDEQHGEGCKCVECLCKECLLKLEPLKHEEGCKCTQCTCVECLLKISTGDQLTVPKQQDGIKERGDNCICQHCICIDCSGKGYESIDKGPARTEEQSSELPCNCPTCQCPEGPNKEVGDKHDETCTCELCQCPEGPNKEVGDKRDETCTCELCQCPEGPNKEVGDKHDETCTCELCQCPEGPNKEMGDKHDENCTCKLCQCKPCPKKEEEKAEPCNCPECKCIKCTKTREVGMGDKGVHSPVCDCPVCACPDPIGAKQSPGPIGAKESRATKTPSKCSCTPVCKCKPCPKKEEEKAEPCNCPECKCIKCTKIREVGMGDKETHSPVCDCPVCACPDPISAKESRATKTPSKCSCTPVCKCEKSKESSKVPSICKCESGGDTGKRIKCVCSPICKCEKSGETSKAPSKCTCSLCKCESGDSKPLKCTCSPVCKCEKSGESVKAENSGELIKAVSKCECSICKCEDGDVQVLKCVCAPACKCESIELKCVCSPVCKCSESRSREPVKEPTKIPPTLLDPPMFEPPQRIDCDCNKCDCVICAQKKGQVAVAKESRKEFGRVEGVEDNYVPPPFEIPVRLDCMCARCDCIFCNKKGPRTKEVAAQPSRPITTPPEGTKTVSVQPSQFKSPGTHPTDCICDQCVCPPVESAVTTKESRKGVGIQQSKAGSEHPSNLKTSGTPSGAPVHCDCPTCACNEAPEDAKTVSVQRSQFKSPGAHPTNCICDQCVCPPVESAVTTKESRKGVGIQQSKAGSEHPSNLKTLGTPSGAPIHCDCPTCACNEGEIRTTILNNASAAPSTAASNKSGTVAETFESAETLELPKPDLRAHMIVGDEHPARCDCPQCKCKPCADPGIKMQQSVKQMDNVTLVKSIQAANKENCECKEQIEEIKKTLERIRCACNEAEFRSTQSIAQTMGQTMDTASRKPFVKQASVFGQTMSGLKMALTNLQAKCQAKDKMIEAMTGELEIRGAPDAFDKVLDRAMKPITALDYDQADDVKSIDRSQMVTNIILAPVATADQGTAPCDLRCVASKSVEVRTHKHKKKKEKEGSAKKLNCSCSKPQIIQKEEKDCQKLDLEGFEVIDIRRITEDSLIVKWNPPKCPQISGYDIFVNGSLASKVMSGTRTSAMMHSLDLNKSIQITIYAVSRCGRIEPPAIAIYEIKN